MKILYIAPHLSTGGMPAFLYERIKLLKKYYNDIEIKVIEHCLYSTDYNVFKNKIIDLLGEENIFTLNIIHNDINEDEDINRCIKFIQNYAPDIIHFDECPENFDPFNEFSSELGSFIYGHVNRKWKVVETSHNISFNDSNKKYIPEGYILCSPYQFSSNFNNKEVKKRISFYPIKPIVMTKKKIKNAFKELNLDEGNVHIIQIGLWAKFKNQEYTLKIAKEMYKRFGNKYQFHFIGNNADNFREYWQPLINTASPNVKIWYEREDVENFYLISNMVILPSTWECNPLVIREALSYNKPILAFNLDTYQGLYDNYLTNLTNNVEKDSSTIENKVFNSYRRPIRDESQEFAYQHRSFYEKLLQ